MLYNFDTASVSRDDLSARMNDVQTDAMKFLSEGGISRLNGQVEWRGDAAAIIRQVVVDLFKMSDLTPMFLERRTGIHGDTYEFEELINTLRVVEYSPKSDPQIFTPRKGKWTIATSMFELAYGIDLFKVLRRQHTIGEFAEMAANAWTRFYSELAMKSIDTGCATGVVDLKGRAVRTAAVGSSVAKTEVDAALRRMYASNGGGLTIFGSRYAIDPIFDMATNGNNQAAQNELNARGQIGAYRGAKLVEITDERNMFYNQFTKINGLDLEKLLFVGSGTPGAILLEKDMSAFTWELLDQKSGLWSTGSRADVGVLVHTPSRYHVIQLA